MENKFTAEELWDRMQELNNLKASFCVFRQSFKNLNRAMDTEAIDVNDFICDEYPFAGCFNELTYEVEAWIDKALENINIELAK